MPVPVSSPMPVSSVPVLSLKALTALIPNGAKVALPPDYSGTAMTAVLSLIKRGVRDLHLVGVPVLGFQADQLIGAKCVARIESAAVTLGEHGLAPRFTAALKSGEIEMWDATCPAIHAGLQASEKGVPFMPLRGLIGSDLLRVRPDWCVIQNPVAESGVNDPIVVLPAIRPDVALFHAARADVYGNVWIGIRRELMLMAHASKATYVTVERIEDTNFLTDPELAAGTIPSLYVSALAVSPNGAAPVGLADAYGPDQTALARYASAARSTVGFQSWLDEALRVREPA
jgi:glutaconate CoA-transferase, subunit A